MMPTQASDLEPALARVNAGRPTPHDLRVIADWSNEPSDMRRALRAAATLGVELVAASLGVETRTRQPDQPRWFTLITSGGVTITVNQPPLPFETLP